MHSKLITTRQFRREHGVALLSVIFILVFISIFAVYLVESDYLHLRRAQNLRDAEQAYHLALGSEQWSARLLQRDMQLGKIDHLDEDWNKLGPPVKVEDGILTTRIADAQAKFNINNLATRDPRWIQLFKELLKLNNIDEELTEAVADWLDADSDRTHSAGAEDTEYLLLDPPYRAANRLFTNIGELRYVKGFNDEILQQIAPFIIALPTSSITKININTCSVELLRILGISDQDAQNLIKERADLVFETVEEFLIRPELAGVANQIAELVVTPSSNYFIVKSRVKYGRIGYTLVSLITRTPQNQEINVSARTRHYL